MHKTSFVKPVLITCFGYPGSGKSYIARQLAEQFKIAFVSTDKLRSELFETPLFDAQENRLVNHLATFMATEFLNAGVSVVFDGESMRTGQRRQLRELARKHKAEYLLIWIQLDSSTAFARTQHRDRRTTDDKFAYEHTNESFEAVLQNMQNPDTENYVVVSGKHVFNTQKNAILNKLYTLGVIETSAVQSGVSKPGLVNLVPAQSGRVDTSRRNIVIR